jgi:hypothetical protein
MAEPGDGELLSRFRCSQGEWYEEETEQFLNTEAIERVTEEPDFYRLLLVLEDELLVACAGYHGEPLLLADGTFIDSVRLHVLALATERQGVTLNDGVNLVDAILGRVIRHAAKELGFNLFTAVVAQENERCLAVLERLGYWSQIPRDELYLRVTKRFETG